MPSQTTAGWQMNLSVPVGAPASDALVRWELVVTDTGFSEAWPVIVAPARGGTDAPLPDHLAAYFTCEPPAEGLPGRFGVVTAHNPAGKVQDPAANAAADAALKARLERSGLRHFRVTGRSRDGSHQEPGYGVAAQSPEAVRPLSREFRQLAFYWVEEGQVCVLNTGGTLRHRVAAWSERLL